MHLFVICLEDFYFHVWVFIFQLFANFLEFLPCASTQNNVELAFR